MENLYYGRGTDEENASLIKFLDEVFFTNDPSNRDFFNLLPKIYKDKYRPAYNNYIVKDENGYRAAIGAFLTDFTAADAKLKSCCIGNVAVGFKHRSKGYMIDLLNMAIDDLIKDGCDMVFLGGQRQRYGYFGFESSGIRYCFGANDKTLKHALGDRARELEVREVKPEDDEIIDEIAKIHSNRLIFAARPRDAFYDILKSWRSTPYAMFDDGRFVGYFVLNCEKNRVPECGVTDKKYFDAMLTTMVNASEKKSLRIVVAPYDTEWMRYLTVNSEGVHVEGGEACLVLNFKKVISALLKAKAAYNELADGELTVLIHGKVRDEKLKISVSGNAVGVEDFDGEADYELSHHAATRAFMSVFSSDRDVFPPHAQQWLPLPNFIPDLDSM